MAKSDLQMGWSGFSFTYGSSVVVAIAKIKGADLQRQNDKQEWVSDAGIFPTLIVTRALRRRFTLNSGDIMKCLTVPDNTPGTIAITMLDPKNGSGAGALSITLVNAVLVDNDGSGSTNQFGMGKLTFEAFSSDGVTDPLTVVQA